MGIKMSKDISTDHIHWTCLPFMITNIWSLVLDHSDNVHILTMMELVTSQIVNKIITPTHYHPNDHTRMVGCSTFLRKSTIRFDFINNSINFIVFSILKNMMKIAHYRNLLLSIKTYFWYVHRTLGLEHRFYF